MLGRWAIVRGLGLSGAQEAVPVLVRILGDDPYVPVREEAAKAAVPGVGPAKLERYGEDVLAALAESG